MTQIIIYQKPRYANLQRLDHARDAWRLNGARHRPSELRRHFDGRPDVVRVGAASTAAPGPKPKASAGCSARPCRRARALDQPRGPGGGADRRPAAALRRVPAHPSVRIAHRVDKISRIELGGLTWTAGNAQK